MSHKRKNRKAKKYNPKAAEEKRLALFCIGSVLVGRHSFEAEAGEPAFRTTHPSKQKERILQAPKYVDHILDRDHRWRVTAFAESLRPGDPEIRRDGEEFITDPVKLHELTSLVDPAVERCKKKQNHKHLIDWGWEAELLPPKKGSRRPAEDEPDQVIALEI